MNFQTIVSTAVGALLILVLVTVFFVPQPPKGPTFDQRWSQAMDDLYRSQDELRRTGHIKSDDGAICTKKWCDPHPKGDRR